MLKGRENAPAQGGNRDNVPLLGASARFQPQPCAARSSPTASARFPPQPCAARSSPDAYQWAETLAQQYELTEGAGKSLPPMPQQPQQQPREKQLQQLQHCSSGIRASSRSNRRSKHAAPTNGLKHCRNNNGDSVFTAC